jgi:hypothetical protein
MEPNSFDETKLANLDTTEKKELLLFQWFSNLEKDLLKNTINNQKEVESVLLKYLQYLNPPPNGPTRTLIGRCFNIIYTKGDGKTLFDTVAQMQSILNDKGLHTQVKM